MEYWRSFRQPRQSYDLYRLQKPFPLRRDSSCPNPRHHRRKRSNRWNFRECRNCAVQSQTGLGVKITDRKGSLAKVRYALSLFSSDKSTTINSSGRRVCVAIEGRVFVKSSKRLRVQMMIEIFIRNSKPFRKSLYALPRTFPKRTSPPPVGVPSAKILHGGHELAELHPPSLADRVN